MDTYEKKYNEALKEIRELISLLKKNDVITDNGIIESNLQRIFPELRESEDERIRKYIAKIMEDLLWLGDEPFTKEQVLAWLEKQKAQKPDDRFEEAREKYQVEWSEEDERMLKSTIWHISNSLTNGKNTDCKCDLTEWLKEKLKSLRPSWKPSEEQMNILSQAVEAFSLEDNEEDAETLASLYNDLKKLM